MTTSPYYWAGHSYTVTDPYSDNGVTGKVTSTVNPSYYWWPHFSPYNTTKPWSEQSADKEVKILELEVRKLELEIELAKLKAKE
jgi:hypothetical protein